VHGGSQRHLDSFEVQPACCAEVLKDDPEQPAYFTFDSPAGSLRPFFSCAVSVSDRGRARQMSSLVSISVPLNS